MNTVAPSRTHYFLTALGTHPREATYTLNGRTAQAAHAPLALLKLLDSDAMPQTIVCLVTADARNQVLGEFSQQANSLGIAVEPIDIPDADDNTQIHAIVQSVAERIFPNSRLMLDITHGLRDIPFVFYALALYLSSFRNVEITGVWYGKFESAHAQKPLINLRSLLELPQWFHAVKLFQDNGFATVLAERFRDAQVGLPAGLDRGPAKKASEALREFSTAYESGLPLELGLAAGKLCHLLVNNPLNSMPGLVVPLAIELDNSIARVADPLRLDEDGLKDGKAKGEWKKVFVLAKRELRRQASLIDAYMERRQLPMALSLMREWTVSLGVLHKGKPEHWLNRDARMRIERELGAMAQEELRDQLDDLQREWGTFWDQLGKQRNQLAHCGMKPEVAKPRIDRVKPFWDRIKDADGAWPSFGGGQGKLLITPLGMSPGVLYSAVKHIQPEKVLVLGSGKALALVDEAIQQAGFPKKRVLQVTMQDPFNGSDEINGILKQTRKPCLSSDEVVVNLTGGTTLMGVVVQRLSEQARNFQRPTRRFLLTDKRAPEAQRAAPWVQSDIFWLDAGRDEERDND